MHYGQWNDGWGSGSWWMMVTMMMLFWGAIITFAVYAFRRVSHQTGPIETSVPSPPRATPQEILAERFARGEVEPDDYIERLETLPEALK